MEFISGKEPCIKCIWRGIVIQDQKTVSQILHHYNCLPKICQVNNFLDKIMLWLQVKTHLQALGNKQIAVGHQHHHTSLSQAFVAIYKEYGVIGMLILEISSTV